MTIARREKMPRRKTRHFLILFPRGVIV